ncbi:uncharacterized protein LOC113294734 [Papaver somniferum]|uniref:uncharacterized protein LOC113294734 n=1 Tax=Papaver somniferum TaxID=3469 RepID=UPI000E701D5D|nr:uncharacterized protein LOC113294734 [Papaver somniferum]
MRDVVKDGILKLLDAGQRVDKLPYVIYYAIKTLNDAQLNYSTTEKELLAVFFAWDKFRSYLIGSKKLGSITKRNMMSLHPILIVELFDVWGIDFMGPLPNFEGKLRSRWTDPLLVRTVHPHGAVELEDVANKNIFKVNGQRLNPTRN